MSLPQIDYTSRDFSTIRSDMINLIPQLTSKWTDYNASDLGIVMVELFAYMGDILNHYMDRLANESYLSTAVSRQSIAELVQMLGYNLRPESASVVELEIRSDLTTPGATLTKGYKVKASSGESFVTYSDSLFKKHTPYINLKEYNNAEPYDFGSDTKLGFIINGVDIDIDFSADPGYTDSYPMVTAADFVWAINVHEEPHGNIKPDNLYQIESLGAWRAWCWTLDSHIDGAGASSTEYILSDANANFEDWMRGCYITKGTFGTEDTYEGIIRDIVDSNTIRTSADTRTDFIGNSPNWSNGDTYQIKVVPGINYVANGVNFAKIQGVPSDYFDIRTTTDVTIKLADVNSPVDLSFLGFEEDTTTHTVSEYTAVRVYAINAADKFDEPLGTSTGKAYQRFRLGMNNLTYHLSFGEILEGFDITVEVDEGSGYLEWQLVDNFVQSSFNDKVYRVMITDSGKTYVTFGDNTNGRIPAGGSSVKTSYKHGGGLKGNIGAYTIDTLVSDAPTGDSSASVRNFESAYGGQEKESLLSAKINAPQSLRTLDRAVTPADFKYLTDQFPGIAISQCENLAGTTAVYVRILPESWDGANAGWESLITNLTTYLNSKKMVGTTVVIGIPTAVNINVTYTLVVQTGYNLDAMEVEVQSAVESYLNPLRQEASTGQYYMAIGEDVYLDEMIEVVRQIDGVKYFKPTEFYVQSEGDATGLAAGNTSLGITYSKDSAEVRYKGLVTMGGIAVE